ncbi:Holliday junction branch migration protein RuvA [Brochothrix thermosphacta]|uniref:Holliday junction branch migration protein RuvA n=1 Tax=Brochothrix thermosphacta TaxID=2756 RepID=UPI00083F8678|nr:Holliday junction branch migration protein RuvA [Brochothrix thermosphacta]ODJ59752.1 Holliday junction DNA helicase RuvA [Brochothrix thermosphacta]
MFEYLKGHITYICPLYITVDVQGIGYLVHVPNPFSFTTREGLEEQIFIHHHVREDAETLFGFESREERFLFQKLLSVTGIGPKGAMAIIARGELSLLVAAIEGENEGYLVKFPGIGKKTARQIILDLKGKINDIVPSAKQTTAIVEVHSALSEALLALEALGYSAREIKRVETKMEKLELATTDEYIRAGLKLLTN